MKKLFSALLASVLFFSLSCPSFAFDEKGGKHTHHATEDKKMDCCESHEEIVDNSDGVLYDDEFDFDEFSEDELEQPVYFEKCFNESDCFKPPIRGPTSLGPEFVGITVKNE